jgi:hypothetical protein
VGTRKRSIKLTGRAAFRGSKIHGYAGSSLRLRSSKNRLQAAFVFSQTVSVPSRACSAYR